MEILRSGEEFNKMISEDQLVLVEFGSSTCNPCYAIRDRLDHWGAKNPQVKMIYVPAEQYLELAAQNEIMSAPSVVLYWRGREILKKSGLYFSLDMFLEKVERIISSM
ncbi:MAG: thioredoxin family protein [Lachnospiraceae bacterium]|nr:thioredoxin family protein [Lachnospiraceae bacterium]